MTVSAQTFYEKGLEYCGRSHNTHLNEVNKMRFLAHFGTTPGICAYFWKTITLHPKDPSPKYFHLLWALLFLKLYETESVLAGMVGGVDEKTLRKWVWFMLEKIDGLKPRIIRFTNRFKGWDAHTNALISVDGADFRISVPFSRIWYSHKFHGSGVRYEVALCIQTGLIVWTNGPYPCGKWSDITIFRHKLKKKLGRYEYAEADKGYRGDRQIASPDDYSEDSENVMKFDVRARHETVNRRMKDFAVLREKFRHHISKNDMSNHEITDRHSGDVVKKIATLGKSDGKLIGDILGNIDGNISESARVKLPEVSYSMHLSAYPDKWIPCMTSAVAVCKDDGPIDKDGWTLGKSDGAVDGTSDACFDG